MKPSDEIGEERSGPRMWAWVRIPHLTTVGFEPTPLTGTDLESGALDRSATLSIRSATFSKVRSLDLTWIDKVRNDIVNSLFPIVAQNKIFRSIKKR